jgi:hypothetical protein
VPYHFIVGLFESPNTLWSNKGWTSQVFFG